MSEDRDSLIEKNTCAKCKGARLISCVCPSGSPQNNGDSDNKAKDSPKNSHQIQFERNTAAQKEGSKDDKSGLTELNKSTSTPETEQQKILDQQGKNSLQLTPFSTRPVPPLKKGNDKDEIDEVVASTKNNLFNPTPLSMTMRLKP